MRRQNLEHKHICGKDRSKDNRLTFVYDIFFSDLLSIEVERTLGMQYALTILVYLERCRSIRLIVRLANGTNPINEMGAFHALLFS